MLIILSPAKSLDLETPLPKLKPTQPAFLDRTQTLVDAARKLKSADLSALMGISDKLAELNVARFKAFERPFTKDNARPAIYTFDGDVYTGFDVHSLKAADMHYAQSHVRILSGLYGVLRPLDLMQPYRLEMSIALKTKTCVGLYSFWGDLLTRHLMVELAAHNDDTLINLASTEYFRVVHTKLIKTPLVTPVFKELRGNKAQIISFFAKKARGTMARYLLTNRIDRAAGLKDFKADGYAYDPHLSDGKTFTFTRKS